MEGEAAKKEAFLGMRELRIRVRDIAIPLKLARQSASHNATMEGRGKARPCIFFVEVLVIENGERPFSSGTNFNVRNVELKAEKAGEWKFRRTTSRNLPLIPSCGSK